MSSLADHPSLQELAYETLLKDIADVRLRPGDRLEEPALAKRLGISRSPVREAIRRLQQEGLVVARTRAGAEVAGVTADEIGEVYRIRGALEGIAASLAADRRTPEELAGMYSLLDVLALAVEEGMLGPTTEAARDLHQTILESARSPRLSAMVRTLKTRIEQFRNLSLSSPGRAIEAVVGHRAVLDAIAACDSKRSEELMRAHIESAHQVVQGAE
jgi:DNA-binding GntR family transcriptional regulator